MKPRRALELYFSLREDFPLPSTLGNIGKPRGNLKPGEPSQRLLFLATVGRALQAIPQEERETLQRMAYLAKGENIALRRALSASNRARKQASHDLEVEAMEWRNLEAQLQRERRNLERREGYREAMAIFTAELDRLS